MVATRNQTAADEVTEAIKAEHGSALAVRVDVSVEADVEGMVATTVSAFGRLDVLLNNAAITPNAQVLDMTFEDFMNVLRVNLGGQFLARRAAARIMVQQGGGRIINLTSARGVVGAPGLAAYSASKAAINNLTNVLHQELSHLGVRTVAVAPGLTDTPGMPRAVGADHIARVASTYPRRPARPARGPHRPGRLPWPATTPTPISGTVISVRP